MASIKDAITGKLQGGKYGGIQSEEPWAQLKYYAGKVGSGGKRQRAKEAAAEQERLRYLGTPQPRMAEQAAVRQSTTQQARRVLGQTARRAQSQGIGGSGVQYTDPAYARVAEALARQELGLRGQLQREEDVRSAQMYQIPVESSRYRREEILRNQMARIQALQAYEQVEAARAQNRITRQANSFGGQLTKALAGAIPAIGGAALGGAIGGLVAAKPGAQIGAQIGSGSAYQPLPAGAAYYGTTYPILPRR